MTTVSVELEALGDSASRRCTDQMRTSISVLPSNTSSSRTANSHQFQFAKRRPSGKLVRRLSSRNGSWGRLELKVREIRREAMDNFDAFKPWFYAAAVYNAIWGTLASLFPDALFRMLGMPPLNYPSMFQCIGMMVGVYAIAYWLIARDPVRFGPLVYVGLLGKVLGPVGFVWSALQHQLPWSFGWINVFNDLVWLPAFVLFAVKVWKRELKKMD